MVTEMDGTKFNKKKYSIPLLEVMDKSQITHS